MSILQRQIHFLIFSFFLIVNFGYSVELFEVKVEKYSTPEYLFKVLSIENWEASQDKECLQLSNEDHLFIHFAKEDQLEQILDKYWKSVPKFVVLKLDTTKLNGNMVFETNPNGVNKYYHLYDGCIPFEAIVEAKTVIAPLSIVQVGHPVLRQSARPLLKSEILSFPIQNLIERMKETMRLAPGVGLAAPQVGEALQIIVIEDEEKTQSHLTKEQLQERERSIVPFHVLINPVLYIEEEDTAEFFEGCLSVPNLIGVVSRAKAVKVEGLNERGESITIQARGWYARILQHEIDHLNGKLFLDCVHTRTLTTQENYSQFWQDKSIPEVTNN